MDSWEETNVKNEDTNEDSIEDCWKGEEKIKEVSEDKYLGDIISNDGRNLKNIKARISKGQGIVSRIMTLLEGIPFGRHYFEVAMILRDSLLVSSKLFNTEAWYNITLKELQLLETVDHMFLRRLLGAPKCTPKEMLYLELGCIPFRDIIRKRRLLFLHYILNEREDSLIQKVFQSQLKNRTKKDWIASVLKT